MHKAVQMTYAISVVTESIKNGVFVTKRFMYYHCKEVYDSNKVANTMLDHICCIFSASYHLWMYLSRKWILWWGHLEVKLRGGRTLDYSVDFDGEW